MSQDISLRQANAADIDALCTLIFEHGPNPWNHLPPAEVREHLQAIASGEVQAILASNDTEMLGFVSYRLANHLAHYQPLERNHQQHAYICEAVIARQAAGQGLGSRLLLAAVDKLAEQGIKDIYIDRHEENAASAGMMRKAGFVEIDCFDDKARRPNGSGRTSVCCIRV
ncbi:GNAT family N-acetyltransferase [Pseudomonas sp. EL_65y_Pfl2_R95]|uniref:GNAT family N-acetyltransferase n=1 Tax=Pseudomonas sp. EL_65y_Pfl2_R95 TaxID=3088698 RepID=UPI0030DAC793